MEISNKILEKLQEAKSVVVLTGAGVSAESGLPTFRDPNGMWSKINPQGLASIEGFLANPELVWSWYLHRRELIETSVPNPGHYAIAELQKLFPKFTIITQNVDRMHHRAGSTNVIELHGNILENHCHKCKRDRFPSGFWFLTDVK